MMMTYQLRALLARLDAGEISPEQFVAEVRSLVDAAGELTPEERAEVERLNNELLAKRRSYNARDIEDNWKNQE